MAIKPSVKINPDDLVRFLLYQQFYYGNDKIYNRTKDKFEYIKGTGNTIDLFYNLITKPIELIDEGKIQEYLSYFHSEIYPINVKFIYSKYLDNKEMLGDSMDRSISLTVLVGESLLESYQHCFNEAIKEFISYSMNSEINIPPYSKSEKKEKIESKLQHLYTLGDPIVGMIYSLSILQFMAQKVNHSSVLEISTKKLQEKYKKLKNQISK